MTLQKRLASAIATGAVLLNLATPALAATEITISGNGRDSDNAVNVTQNGDTNVTQNNYANISNNVNVSANTGNNKANDNAGGNVEIDTGNSTTNVSVANAANTNAASVDCCPTGNTSVDVSGNLRDSNNTVNLTNNSDTNVWQNNTADIDNNVNVSADTGNNRANDNGGGNVTIETGNVNSTVSLATLANANSALIGGNGSDNGNGEVSAWITGNGRDTDNEIRLDFDNDTTVTQFNNADVDNDVYVDANTGNNKANDNVGGNVEILTGDADADLTVDNMVNFNAADIDCGCLLDVLAKINGNLRDSDNTIKANFNGDQTAYQTNGGDLWNDLDVDADTGNNESNDNGGNVDSDPLVDTGDSEIKVAVENTANSNMFGDGAELELPGGLGLHLSFNLDIEDLLDLLGL